MINQKKQDQKHTYTHSCLREAFVLKQLLECDVQVFRHEMLIYCFMKVNLNLDLYIFVAFLLVGQFEVLPALEKRDAFAVDWHEGGWIPSERSKHLLDPFV